jgi:hypothetical protein
MLRVGRIIEEVVIHEIASAIVEQGADYVLALKANQPSLYEDVQWLFAQAQATEFRDLAQLLAQA